MPAFPTPGRTSDGTPPGPPSRRRSLIPGIAPEQLRAAGIGQVVEWFDGLVLRRDMQETADTKKIDRRVTLGSLFEPMRRHPRQTIQVIGLTIGFTAMVYAWGTYFPTYAATYEGLNLQWPLLPLFVTSVAMIFVTPLAGLVTDRLGRKPVLITAGVLLTVGTVPALAFLNDSVLRLIVIQVLGNCVIALIQASSMPAYAELFPKKFRAAGFGIPLFTDRWASSAARCLWSARVRIRRAAATLSLVPRRLHGHFDGVLYRHARDGVRAVARVTVQIAFPSSSFSAERPVHIRILSATSLDCSG